MRSANLANRCTMTLFVVLCAITMAAEPVVGQSPATIILKRISVEEKLAQRGDLKLRNTPLPEALVAITKVWNVNFASRAEVQGVVTGTYTDSTLREVLQTILLTHGYSYQVVGQTIVIGGLMRDSMVKSESKVPVLGSIPILGLLFRNKKTTRVKTELIIFIRPIIVEEGMVEDVFEEEFNLKNNVEKKLK